jgi:DNA/RNA-binding domain of Phe-tRNA-synthetase-like protein
LSALFSNDAATPFEKSDAPRAPIRDLLRLGGYKPTGRGKPASEYLARAALDGALTSINLAVDACNVVSLHTGIPISVIDLERAHAPFTVQIAGTSSTYVFNASGQHIDLEGLLCLFDAEGPCANAVKDSQRTKTHAATRATLSVLWNARSLEQLGDRACAWYRELLANAGATTEDVELTRLA